MMRLKILLITWIAAFHFHIDRRVRSWNEDRRIARLARDIDRLEERHAQLQRLRKEIDGSYQDLLLDVRLSAPRPDLIRLHEALQKKRIEHDELSCVHQRDTDRVVCRVREAKRRRAIEERFGMKGGRLS